MSNDMPIIFIQNSVSLYKVTVKFMSDNKRRFVSKPFSFMCTYLHVKKIVKIV